MFSVETRDGRIQTRTDTISHSVIREMNIICINSVSAVVLLKLEIPKKKKLAADQLGLLVKISNFRNVSMEN